MKILCIEHKNYVLERDGTWLGLQVKSTEKEKDPQVRRRLGSPLRSDSEKMKYEPTHLKKCKEILEPRTKWRLGSAPISSYPLQWNRVRPHCVPRRAAFCAGDLGSSSGIRNGLSTFTSSSQCFLRAFVRGVCLWDPELAFAADPSICHSEDSLGGDFWEIHLVAGFQSHYLLLFQEIWLRRAVFAHVKYYAREYGKNLAWLFVGLSATT